MFSYFKELVTVYTTTRLVRIQSPIIAILNCVLVALVWASYLGSLNLDIRKVYQSSCPVRGVVLSKVKGFASTENLSIQDIGVDNPELYQRTWDPADIVYPAQGGEGETGSFTIVTNLVITPNQTLSRCAEELSPLTKCTKDSDCKKGYWSANSHGVYTGKCTGANGSCEIEGWCPIERDKLPRFRDTEISCEDYLTGGKRVLLDDVENFTVMLKNTVEFPECGNQQGRNIQDRSPDYIKTCIHNKETDPLCPIFRIGDIIKWSGDEFSRVAIKGGVFRIKVMWQCDFDFGHNMNNCSPKYEFVRVDDREAGVSKGWNFRSADFYSEDRRTLKKQYGLKILINLEGEGRQFSFFVLIITIGATIGLFSVAPLFCDFLLEVFNLISNSRICCRAFDSFHDAEMSRYDEHPTSVTVSTPDSNFNGGASRHGISNKTFQSTTSINNESFKGLPES